MSQKFISLNVLMKIKDTNLNSPTDKLRQYPFFMGYKLSNILEKTKKEWNMGYKNSEVTNRKRLI